MHFPSEPILVSNPLEDSPSSSLNSAEGKVTAHQEHQLSSTGRMFLNLLKIYIGAGILGLPFAFSQSGLILGIISLVVIAFVSDFGITLILECKREVDHKGVVSYGDIGFHLYGKGVKILIDVFLLITQLGYAISYLIFIGSNMHSLVDKLSMRVWVLICGPPLTLLLCLPSFKYLAPFSFLAMMSVMAGVGIVIYYGIDDMVDRPSSFDQISLAELSTFPSFFGVAVFTFEGIGLAIPMERNMKYPQQFSSINRLAYVFLTCLFVFFASVGYLAYHSDVKSIITANLPTTGIVSSVKAFLSFALLLSHPLMMIPVTETLEDYFFTSQTSMLMFKRGMLRIFLVAFTIAIAVGVTHFGYFISAVGSFAGSFLAFVLPGWLHFKLFHKRRSMWVKASDVVLVLFGFVAGGISTVYSFKDLISCLADSANCND